MFRAISNGPGSGALLCSHALAMIADGLIDVRRFIQKRVSLEQLQSGLEAIENGEVLKCMVTKF